MNQNNIIESFYYKLRERLKKTKSIFSVYAEGDVKTLGFYSLNSRDENPIFPLAEIPISSELTLKDLLDYCENNKISPDEVLFSDYTDAYFIEKKDYSKEATLEIFKLLLLEELRHLEDRIESEKKSIQDRLDRISFIKDSMKDLDKFFNIVISQEKQKELQIKNN